MVLLSVDIESNTNHFLYKTSSILNHGITSYSDYYFTTKSKSKGGEMVKCKMFLVRSGGTTSLNGFLFFKTVNAAVTTKSHALEYLADLWFGMRDKSRYYYTLKGGMLTTWTLPIPLRKSG